MTVAMGTRLEVSDLDVEAAFRAQPLDAGALRCLRYMSDIESHTVCYLRDLLVTNAHTDPELTAFFTMWNYEEFWHGEALGRVLVAHGLEAGPSRIAEVRRGKGAKDRFRPLGFMAGSVVVPDMPAVALTWGAINEWTTQAAYARLVDLTGHPTLTELLRRVMRQEGRHIDFYAAQSRARLAASRATQRVTRFALRHFWSPVGSGVRPRSETAFMIRYLFGGAAGAKAAARIDRNIARLPGLGGLTLVADARRAYGVADVVRTDPGGDGRVDDRDQGGRTRG